MCMVTARMIGKLRKQISGSECPTRSGAHAIAEQSSYQGLDRRYRSRYTSDHSRVAGKQDAYRACQKIEYRGEVLGQRLEIVSAMSSCLTSLTPFSMVNNGR